MTLTMKSTLKSIKTTLKIRDFDGLKLKKGNKMFNLFVKINKYLFLNKI